jgi:hypothetical protein
VIVVVLTVVVCDAVVVTGMASGSEGGGAMCRVGVTGGRNNWEGGWRRRRWCGCYVR